MRRYTWSLNYRDRASNDTYRLAGTTTTFFFFALTQRKILLVWMAQAKPHRPHTLFVKPRARSAKRAQGKKSWWMRIYFEVLYLQPCNNMCKSPNKTGVGLHFIVKATEAGFHRGHPSTDMCLCACPRACPWTFRWTLPVIELQPGRVSFPTQITQP